jgi:23S rRNA (guanosine2251-2'-O)-methyltransferase
MVELVVVLADVRSTHNVGSIFRTADGAGFSKIYLCGVTPSPLDRFGKVRKDISKVSLGAESWLPWESSASTTRLLTRLRKEGYKIFALEQAKGSVLYDAVKLKKNEKVALLLGEETKGLPASILSKVDKVLEIPMRGRKESLNVSVAFGIAAYALSNGVK